MLLRSPWMVAMDARNSLKVERLDAIELFSDIAKALDMQLNPSSNPNDVVVTTAKCGC